MEDKIIAAIIGVFFGFISTYLAAILKFRQDLRAQYDKDLRDKRIEEYRELWELTGAFPKYAVPKSVTYGDANKLAENLRIWYFGKGGMFLSDDSRNAYFKYQEAFKKILADETEDLSRPLGKPGDRTYELLRQRGSKLRSALVRDVGTRKASELN